MSKLVVAIALLLSIATGVAADDKTKQAAAHFKKGEQHLAKQAYEQAIVEFQTAYALDHKAGHLYNIARAYELKGDPKNAIEMYEKYLAEQPGSPKAAEIREYIATAGKRLAEEDEQRRKTEAAARAVAEAERKRVLVDGFKTQAQAFSRTGAWKDAAEQYLKALEVDGDPGHLVDAGNAYRKVPDLVTAKQMYEQFLELAPTSPQNVAVRASIADLTREMDRAAQAERDRAIAATLRPDTTERPPEKRVSRLWLVAGGALIASGVVVDLAPSSSSNRELDAVDFAPPMLYGLGATAILIAIFKK